MWKRKTMRNKVAVIGECMLEVSTMGGEGNRSSLPAGLSFGGDTLNTAIYLARLGIDVDYVSALGDDDMSGWMLEQWRAEGVGCNLVDRIENTVPGLYLIQIDEQGERSFRYWRADSPASRMFDDAADMNLHLSQEFIAGSAGAETSNKSVTSMLPVSGAEQLKISAACCGRKLLNIKYY